jgi:hypothetical protein
MAVTIIGSLPYLSWCRSGRCWSWFAHPAVMASVVTAVNATKPAVVDDTAYLLYARHIATHPSDPYGFTIFWYTWPQPAFEVLAPPVYLYWLALGWRLFGDHILWLKCWTWPWLLLFAYSLRTLLQRFNPTAAVWLVPMILLSPTIVPMVNLMLDIPAYALGLAGLAVGLISGTPSLLLQLWRALAAGVCLGLAVQTKYVLFTFLAVILTWGILCQRWKMSLLSVLVAFAVFAGWEVFCYLRYGQSHFLYHALQQTGHQTLGEWWHSKAFLIGPLLGHWGYLGAAVSLCIGSAVGVSPRRSKACVGLWLIGALIVCGVPERFLLLPSGLSLVLVFWQGCGLIFFIGIGYGLYWLWSHAVGAGKQRSYNRFLVIWWLLELGGYYLLTPFGAARRLIGLSLVSHLIAAQLAQCSAHTALFTPPAKAQGCHPIFWAIFSVGMGCFVAAIDTLDAYPEKWCVEQAARILETTITPTAAEVIRTSTEVWFAGHWGFQHYAQRHGWLQIEPQQSYISAGAYVVVPVPPDPDFFYRPHIGSRSITLPAGQYVTLAELIWDDLLPTQTIPNLYGGQVMLVGRNYPRLRVVVARLTAPWRP